MNYERSQNSLHQLFLQMVHWPHCHLSGTILGRPLTRGDVALCPLLRKVIAWFANRCGTADPARYEPETVHGREFYYCSAPLRDTVPVYHFRHTLRSQAVFDPSATSLGLYSTDTRCGFLEDICDISGTFIRFRPFSIAARTGFGS